MKAAVLVLTVLCGGVIGYLLGHFLGGIGTLLALPVGVAIGMIGGTIAMDMDD